MNVFVLFLAFAVAWVVTRLSLPVLARYTGKYLLDAPGGLKHHAAAVPVLGGCGIFIGMTAALVCIRLTTNFPSGTLHSLRGIIWGGLIIFTMGLLDDLRKPQGLPVWIKLLLQGLATACLIYYGILVRFIEIPWISFPITFLWVVGLTNAFNLLDILDGLCTTQAMVCTLGLAVIALPSEFIYVNFAALALLGAGAAFLPFNFSVSHKLFLGDSGSNLLGFLIAALCLGTGYSQTSSWGFLAPLLIVAVPLADVAFVSVARVLQGKNPLKGSDDHAALRLKKTGWSSGRVVGVFAAVAVGCNALGFVVTRCTPLEVSAIFLGVALGAVWTGYILLKRGGCHAR